MNLNFFMKWQQHNTIINWIDDLKKEIIYIKANITFIQRKVFCLNSLKHILFYNKFSWGIKQFIQILTYLILHSKLYTKYRIIHPQDDDDLNYVLSNRISFYI